MYTTMANPQNIAVVLDEMSASMASTREVIQSIESEVGSQTPIVENQRRLKEL
jgi:hypothetical protein